MVPSPIVLGHVGSTARLRLHRRASIGFPPRICPTLWLRVGVRFAIELVLEKEPGIVGYTQPSQLIRFVSAKGKLPQTAPLGHMLQSHTVGVVMLTPEVIAKHLHMFPGAATSLR